MIVWWIIALIGVACAGGFTLDQSSAEYPRLAHAERLAALEG